MPEQPAPRTCLRSSPTCESACATPTGSIWKTRWSYGPREDHPQEQIGRGGGRLLPAGTACRRRTALLAPAKTSGDQAQKIRRPRLVVLPPRSDMELRGDRLRYAGRGGHALSFVFAAVFAHEAGSDRSHRKSHGLPRIGSETIFARSE